MSVNKYNALTGELTTLASGTRCWIGTKDAYNTAKQAGTLPTDCLIAITDDENEQAISGTNLLDNPWFTVNQRGQSSYSNGYAVDRWKANSGMTCDVTDNGVTLTHPDNTDNADFLQYYESDRLKDAVGKNVTVSVMTSDGNIYTQTGEVPTIENSRKVVVRFDIGSTAFKCDLIIRTSNPFLAFYSTTANATISIKAVKLELGSASTLENDTAPNYATELLKCQRYFYRFKSYITGVSGFTGYSAYEGGIRFMFPLPVAMRIYPTLTTSNVSDWGASQTNLTGAIPATTVKIDGRLGDNNMSVTFENSAYTVSKAWLMYALNTNAYIDFSADL